MESYARQGGSLKIYKICMAPLSFALFEVKLFIISNLLHNRPLPYCDISFSVINTEIVHLLNSYT